MRIWLARFGFSFLVLACVLFYTTWQRQKVEGTTARVVMQAVGGALLAGAGLAGLRERHRPPPMDE